MRERRPRRGVALSWAYGHVFSHLHITDWRERWLVGLTDWGLRLLTWPFRTAAPRRDRAGAPPKRILLLRLERVGDLLMVLDAIATLRAAAPDARLDLVVGSWNAALARTIPNLDSVETLDVPWMARTGAGQSWPSLLGRARRWRAEPYDLAINFESDIRSNLLLAVSGATRRIGFFSGGGGSLLTDPVEADRTAHVAANAADLVARAFPTSESDSGSHRPPTTTSRLLLPEAARARAAELLADAQDGGVLVGIQPGAGRQLREWDPSKFGAVAAELARTRNITFVLTGSASDIAALTAVKATWPAGVRLLELPLDTDLVVLAAVLERLALLITGDTGPMHLAAAVGTPIVAIFGPSLPSRYAPLSSRARIVRIDLPCSPCNRLRQPPARCVGHVPDCLAGIEPFLVVQAANELLNDGVGPRALRVLQPSG